MNPLKGNKKTTLRERKAKVQRSAETFALRLLALFILATLLSPAVGWLTSLDGDGGGSPMIVEVNTPTTVTDDTVTTITIAVADASPETTTNTPGPAAPEAVPAPPVESTVRGLCPKQLGRCQHVHGGQQ